MAFWQNLQKAYNLTLASKPVQFWRDWGRFAWMPISAVMDIAYSKDVEPPLLGNIAGIGAAIAMRHRRGILPFVIPAAAYTVGRGIGYSITGKTPIGQHAATLKARIADVILRHNESKEKTNTITGLSHTGIAGTTRSQNTDFGSGYQGDRHTAQEEFNFFAGMLGRYGEKIDTSHKRILMPKEVLTEDEIKELGFVPVKIAVPESGETRVRSFRHPRNLYHIHEHGDMWSLHRDRHVSATMLMLSEPGHKLQNVLSGTKHIFTEGIPGVYYWLKGKITDAPSTVTKLFKDITPEYWERLKSFTGYELPSNKIPNTISGLHHKGMAGANRSKNTDFGSGYQGLDKSVALGLAFGVAGKSLYGWKGAILGKMLGMGIGYGMSALEKHVSEQKQSWLGSTIKYGSIAFTYDLLFDIGLVGLARGGALLPERAADWLAKTKFGRSFERATGRSVASPTGLLFKFSDLFRNYKPTSEFGKQFEPMVRRLVKFSDPILLNPALVERIEKAGSLGAISKSKLVKGMAVNAFKAIPAAVIFGLVSAGVSQLWHRNKAPNEIKGHDAGHWGRERTFASGDFEPGSSWIRDAIKRGVAWDKIGAAVVKSRGLTEAYYGQLAARALQEAHKTGGVDNVVRAIREVTSVRAGGETYSLGAEVAGGSFKTVTEAYKSGYKRGAMNAPGQRYAWTEMLESPLVTTNAPVYTTPFLRSSTAGATRPELTHITAANAEKFVNFYENTIRSHVSRYGGNTLAAEIVSQKIARGEYGNVVPEILGTTERGFIQEWAGTRVADHLTISKIRKTFDNMMTQSGQHVVHFDLHPGNIMRRGGKLKVIDWGLAAPTSVIPEIQTIGQDLSNFYEHKQLVSLKNISEQYTIPKTLSVETTSDLRTRLHQIQTKENLEILQQMTQEQQLHNRISSKLSTRDKMNIGQQSAQSAPFELNITKRRSHGKVKRPRKKK